MISSISRCIVCIIWSHRNILLFLAFLATQQTSSFDIMSSTLNNNNNNKLSFDVLDGKHILVVGGSGRVGGSVTTQLLQHGANVLVGGTNYERYEKSRQRWKTLFPNVVIDDTNLNFCTVNSELCNTIESVIIHAKDKNTPIDLIVHTAGPFQGKVNTINGIIDASIKQQIPYIDVCDDYCTAMATKTKYSIQANTNNVPCIISSGCWPGVSSLMAKSLLTNIIEQSKNAKNTNNNNDDENNYLTPNDIKIDFSFFTAGSGGAGVTLLVATFLILSEFATIIVNGQRQHVPPMQTYYNKNFGKCIGNKSVSHLNLLETCSIADCLHVSNVVSYFGTAPTFWNTLLGFMARSIPSSILANEQLMLQLSQFSLPIVRIVDYFAGATNVMRCDISIVHKNENNINENNVVQSSSISTTSSPKSSIVASAIYGHENLEVCVGECITGFIVALLTKDVVQSGVWFPEEAIESSYLSSVLSLASIGAHTKDVISSSDLSNNDNDDDENSIIKLYGIQTIQQNDVWGSSTGTDTTLVDQNTNLQKVKVA